MIRLAFLALFLLPNTAHAYWFLPSFSLQGDTSTPVTVVEAGAPAAQPVDASPIENTNQPAVATAALGSQITDEPAQAPASSVTQGQAHSSSVSFEAPRSARTAPLSPSEYDRVLSGQSFDLTYDLSDGVTQEALGSFPITVYYEVEVGDTLSKLFERAGVAYQDTSASATALSEHFNIASLRPGQIIELELDGAIPPLQVSRLQRVALSPTNLEKIEVVRTPAGFESRLVQVDLRRVLVHARGMMETGSIYIDGAALDIEGTTIANFVNALDAQVNFSRVQSIGDEIELVYEAFFNDEGDLVDAGNVLYAAYTDSGGSAYEAFRFEDSGKTSYYTRDARFTGESNTLMRKPVGGGRISSPFGWRTHPIYGDRRMHWGIDYAIGCGTPVYAAGNGVVTFAGWKGGYGRFVGLRHGSNYVTNYAHLRSFANGIRPGVRVTKGQLIARVGNTGASTGCHLHYEVARNGERINPLSDHIPRGDDLGGGARTRFRAFVGTIDQERETSTTLRQAMQLTSS